MLYQIDRQQYDEHTPNTSCKIQTSYASRRYDAWCKYFVSNRSFNKHSYTSTVYQVDNSKNDVVIYLTMTGTHVVPDTSSILDYDKHTRCTGQMTGTHVVPVRQQYDENTQITSCLTHIQLLYGILYTTTSRPSTNTSPITLKFQNPVLDNM